MKNNNFKEKILEKLEDTGGFKDFYSLYFTGNENKDMWQVLCPFHSDHKPSMDVNIRNGLFHCFGCGKSGDIFNFRMENENIDFKECLERFVKELKIENACPESAADRREKCKIKRINEESTSEIENSSIIEIDPENASRQERKKENSSKKTKKKDKDDEEIPVSKIIEWSNNFFTNSGAIALDFLNNVRGLDNSTLKKYHVGYSSEKRAITIPMLDQRGEKVLTVKYFKYNYITGEKSISTEGRAQLFGLDQLFAYSSEHERVYITEGEFDAMVLNQHGFLAVSGSAGSGTWYASWANYFKDKNVVVCYDSDDAGEAGAHKVVKSIINSAKSVKSISLFHVKNVKERKDITDYFIKEKHTADEFMELVNSAEELKIEMKGISNQMFYGLQNYKESYLINSAQAYWDKVIFYAINIDGSRCLVTSGKECLTIEECTQKGLKVNLLDVDTARFSCAGILAYLKAENNFNPAELFDSIFNYIQRFIFLKDRSYYIYLSLWTIGTYVYKIFRYFPYVHLNAEKGSGKTLLMEVLAPLCFNGQISCNSSEAVLYRDIQNNSLTLFLDEVEKLGKEDKDKYNAVMGVLKTGFSVSGMVKRCAGQNKDKIAKFSTYSPKMFAGIKDIDDVLFDRAVKIPMVRKLNDEFTERYTETADVIEFQKMIRDNLYIFGLSNAAVISDLYNEMISEIGNLSHLNNRELDIWLPILLLAKLVDDSKKTESDSVLETMINFSKNVISERMDFDKLRNDTMILLNTLNNMISEIQPFEDFDDRLLYTTDSVFEYFQKQDEYHWLSNKMWLSKALKKVNVQIYSKREMEKVKKYYIINLNNLRELSLRYNVIDSPE